MSKRSSPRLIRSYLSVPDFRLVAMHTWHNSPDDTPNVHEHRDFYELVIVCSGSGFNESEYGKENLQAGSVFLLHPHDKHTYKNYHNLEIYNVLFGQKIMRLLPDDLAELAGFQKLFRAQVPHEVRSALQIDDAVLPEILHDLDEMEKFGIQLKPGNRCLVLSYFLKIIALLAMHVHEPLQTASASGHIRQMVQIQKALQEHLAEAWSLERMAKLTGMSVSGFRQEFKKAFQVPPLEYLIRLRLERAKFFMQNHRKTSAEAAQLCGFHDTGYFTRQYRKYCGDLPVA